MVDKSVGQYEQANDSSHRNAAACGCRLGLLATRSHRALLMGSSLAAWLISRFSALVTSGLQKTRVLHDDDVQLMMFPFELTQKRQENGGSTLHAIVKLWLEAAIPLVAFATASIDHSLRGTFAIRSAK